MFSDLRQNSTVYILNKQGKLSVKTGIVSNTPANINSLYGGFNNTPILFDIEVNVEGKTEKYEKLATNQNIISYNNGSVILSDSKDVIIKEVETIVNTSKTILNNKDYYENSIIEGEQILKELSPTFAKDKERDEEINNLHKQVSGINDKIDKLFTILSKSNT